ncbi:hypothetical protein ACJOV8_012950 [Formosa sp. 3Alg 14/1]|uniref:hypothetical protein n=1 Tax=Formosa sp. 3Alg 14/1 TaxID=3382190 RepID=UPI0039BDC869
MKTLRHDLAEHITNHHSVWSKLLANTNFGNYALSLWDVTLKTEDIVVNRDDKTFSFQHANFTFDVEVGMAFGEKHSLFSKQVSGRGTFQ